MVFHLLLLLSILFAYTVKATDESKDQECIDACLESVGYATFVGDDPDVYYYGLCQNPPKVLSVYACGVSYCSSHEMDEGIKLWSKWCWEYGPDLELLPISYFSANLTNDAIKNLTMVTMNDTMTATDPYSNAFLITEDFFQGMDRTVKVWVWEMWSHVTFGWAMYAFWGGLLIVGMTKNAINWWFSRLSYNSDGESLSYPKTKAPRILIAARTWFDKWFAVPFLFGNHHQRFFFGSKIPTRSVSIVVFCYWVLNIVLCTLNYDAFLGNLYWADISPQLWRYVADRTGILCFANLPWLWLFAGRNNIFLWATGWNFSTFNIYHRNVARVALIQAIVHSIAYTVIYMAEGKEEYYEAFDEAWFTLGVVATVLMGLIIATSSTLLRQKAYEVFLIVHILMSVAVIVCLFYHVSEFDGEYNGYLCSLVAIWSFDRFLRLVRLVHCNLRIKTSKQLIAVTETVASYNSLHDVIMLEMTASSAVKPLPGQYYFIYQPFNLKGWENHPFTLGAWNSTPINSITDSPRTPSVSDSTFNKDIKYPVSSTTKQLPGVPRSDTSDSVTNSQTRLIFWIRPFDGWTRQIRNQCKASPNETFQPRLLIEGPYGHYAPLCSFESVLLIGGGTGVSAVSPYLQEHVQRLETGSPTRTKKMHLVFSARQPAFVRLVYDTALISSRKYPDVDIKMYSTDKNIQSNSSEAIDTSRPISPIPQDTETDLKPSPLRIERHRPDITASILEFARQNHVAGTNCGMAVMVCGPSGMADEARAAIMEASRQGLNVKYFEEAFGW